MTDFLTTGTILHRKTFMTIRTLQDALSLFELPNTVKRDGINERYQKLLYTWHPNRYASLTNNPKKYMEMYKKGEEKTKDIHIAYRTLIDWLEKKENPPT